MLPLRVERYRNVTEKSIQPVKHFHASLLHQGTAACEHGSEALLLLVLLTHPLMAPRYADDIFLATDAKLNMMVPDITDVNSPGNGCSLQQKTSKSFTHCQVLKSSEGARAYGYLLHWVHLVG